MNTLFTHWNNIYNLSKKNLQVSEVAQEFIFKLLVPKLAKTSPATCSEIEVKPLGNRLTRKISELEKKYKKWKITKQMADEVAKSTS